MQPQSTKKEPDFSRIQADQVQESLNAVAKEEERKAILKKEAEETPKRNAYPARKQLTKTIQWMKAEEAAAAAEKVDVAADEAAVKNRNLQLFGQVFGACAMSVDTEAENTTDKIFLAQDIFEEKEKDEGGGDSDNDLIEERHEFPSTLPLEVIMEELCCSTSAKDPLAEELSQIPTPDTPDADTTTPPKKKPRFSGSITEDGSASASSVSTLSRVFRKKGVGPESPHSQSQSVGKKVSKSKKKVDNNSPFGSVSRNSDYAPPSASNVSKLRRVKIKAMEVPSTPQSPTGTQMSQSQSAVEVPKSKKTVDYSMPWCSEFDDSDSSDDYAPASASNASALRRVKSPDKKIPSTSQSHAGTQMSQSQSLAKKILKSEKKVDDLFNLAELEVIKNAKLNRSVENGYKANNGLLDYKKVIDWCTKNTGVKEVRLINVVSVEYYNLAAGQGRDLFDKVILPDLKDFQMQIKCLPGSSHARVMDFVRRFGLEEHLFFILTRSINSQFIEELVEKNICISIEGLKLLQVSAQNQSITASFINGNEIVSNLPASVKKISLRESLFPIDLKNCRCENITEVVLSKCIFPSGASLFKFLVKCEKLDSFTLDGYGLKVFNLQRMLPYFLKLKKLALSQVSLSNPLESSPQLKCQYHRLLRLTIVNSIWDESFEKKIPQMFPNLLDVHIGNDDTMSPINWSMIKSLLKCHFIRSMHVWGCRNFPESNDSSEEAEFNQIIKELKKVGKGLVPEYFRLISSDKVQWRKWAVTTGKASAAEDQTFELLRETFFLNRKGYNKYGNWETKSTSQ